MKLIALALGAVTVLAAWWSYRAHWIGVQTPDCESRRAAWRGVAIGYRQTQPKNRWHLRIARKAERRRSA